MLKRVSILIELRHFQCSKGRINLNHTHVDDVILYHKISTVVRLLIHALHHSEWAYLDKALHQGLVLMCGRINS